jgi:hypothetical protein
MRGMMRTRRISDLTNEGNDLRKYKPELKIEKKASCILRHEKQDLS